MMQQKGSKYVQARTLCTYRVTSVKTIIYFKPIYYYYSLIKQQQPLLNEGRLTNDPLDPDDIIASTLWYKVLQAAAEIVPHSLALVSQVCLGFVQKLLRHVHEVHGLEQRQQ